MRRKNYIVVLVLLCAMCSTLLLASCNKEKTPVIPPDDLPQTKSELLNAVGNALANSITANPSKQMKIDIEAALSTQNSDMNDVSSHLFKIQSNIDLNNSAANGIVISLVDVLNEKTIINISCDNANIYFEVANKKYKITNAALFDVVSSLVGDVADALPDNSFVTTVFMAIGEYAFTNGTVNADKTIYSFDFSLKSFLSSEVLWSIFGEIDGLEQAILGIFGASSKEDFVAKLPDCTANISFKVENHLLSNITFNNAKLDDKGFKFSLNKFAFANGQIEGLVYVPENVESFTTTKIGSFRMVGELDFLCKGNSYINYEWKVESNLDLITLINANFDFNQLSDDNFFHFRLYHKCVAGGCNSYCQSKYLLGDGALIDIGFSPKDFGSHNLNISIGIQQLLGPDAIEMLAPGYGDIITLAVPQYLLLSLDTADFQYANTPFNQGSETTEGETAGTDIMSILPKIFSALKSLDLSIADKSLTIDIPALLGSFGLGSDLTGTLNSVLGNKDYSFDGIKLSLDMIKFADAQLHDTYNVYNETVYKKGDTISGSKAYSAIASGSAITGAGPTIGWDLALFEKDGTTALNEDKIIPIFKEYGYSKKDVYFDKDIKITAAELNSLIGKGKIAYTVTGYNEKAGRARALITGIDNINYNLIGVKQTVRFITELPSAWIGDTVKNALPIDLNSFLQASVEATIILSAESDFTYTTRLNETKTYVMGEPMPRGINATMKRDGGEAVELSADGWCGNFVWSNYANAYVAGKPGKFNMTYEIGGKTIVEEITVAEPDDYTVEFADQNSIDVVPTFMWKHKTNDTLLKYGSVTFKTGDKSYTIQLSYGDYTFPEFGSVQTSSSNILSGAVTNGVYFDRVNKECKLLVNLYGIATYERIIDVKDISSQYGYERWTLKGSNVSETNKTINVGTDTKMTSVIGFTYFGNTGAGTVKMVLELQRKNFIGNYEPMYANDYIETSTGSSVEFPAYLPSGRVIPAFTLKLLVEGDIKVISKAIDENGKVIATGFVELTSVYSNPFRTFNGDLAMEEGGKTGTLKLYQLKDNVQVSNNIIFRISSLSKVGENNKTVIMPLNTFEVAFDTTDVDFTLDGTAKDGLTIDVKVSIKNFSPTFENGKYRIAVVTYDATTLKQLGNLGLGTTKFDLDIVK